MEFDPEGWDRGARVNCISLGHIITSMAKKDFEEVPGLRIWWASKNSSEFALSAWGRDSLGGIRLTVEHCSGQIDEDERVPESGSVPAEFGKQLHDGPKLGH